jgi:predicted DCC family thiol-disulfide oxidoreductase YuxK
MMVFMTLPVFPILMMSTYIPFFSEDELEACLEKIRRRYAGRKGKVFFDGACPLCLRSRKIISLMDLFSRIDFVDFRALNAEALPKGVDLKNLEGEMHLVTPRGRVLKGYDSFRWMAARLPATFWLTLFLHIPGVPYLGRKIYRWVAKNRLELVKIEGSDSCPLHGCGHV